MSALCTHRWNELPTARCERVYRAGRPAGTTVTGGHRGVGARGGMLFIWFECWWRAGLPMEGGGRFFLMLGAGSSIKQALICCHT
jgi:hypothetical protein